MEARTASTGRVVAQRVIDAFNRRDVEAIVALCAPDVEFHPTQLVGFKQVYHGHDGLRRWMRDLAANGAGHQVAIREVREHRQGFVVLTEVLLGGERIMSSAMLATTDADGLVTDARAYLSDEEMLNSLGHIPDAMSGSSG
jgi:hypothetical protein